jgi:hypothetical protein
MQQGRKGKFYVVPLKRREDRFLMWPFMLTSLGDWTGDDYNNIVIEIMYRVGSLVRSGFFLSTTSCHFCVEWLQSCFLYWPWLHPEKLNTKSDVHHVYSS